MDSVGSIGFDPGVRGPSLFFLTLFVFLMFTAVRQYLYQF
jgi:hypothetical protein